MRKKILISGISGMLGSNLAIYFLDKYYICGLYNSHAIKIADVDTEKCDLLHYEALDAILHRIRPDIVIHCAALTNVDLCEKDKDYTRAVNVLATKRLMDNLVGKDVKVVYISTDAVYDGVKGDFCEDDEINPLNFYGLSKYEGELEVMRKADALCLRTNIFGWNVQRKFSLGEWILTELQHNRQIGGFVDAMFSSIYTLELAKIIDLAIEKGLCGIYNCASSDSCSKYDFARKIAMKFDLDDTLISQISIDDFNFTARRGKRLTLNVERIQHALGVKLPGIDHSVDRFYRDYKDAVPGKIKHWLLSGK